jgi:hypothetical protein
MLGFYIPVLIAGLWPVKQAKKRVKPAEPVVRLQQMHHPAADGFCLCDILL